MGWHDRLKEVVSLKIWKFVKIWNFVKFSRLHVDAVVRSCLYVVGRVEPQINCRRVGKKLLPSVLEVSPVFCGQFCFLRPILNGLGFVLVARPLTVMVQSTTKPWHQKTDPQSVSLAALSFDFLHRWQTVRRVQSVKVCCLLSKSHGTI
jgi:hypothetical protein